MKCLVIREDRIGDVILSTPVLESIKTNKADSRIFMLVSKETIPVVEDNPYLDGIICEDNKKFFTLYREIKKHAFDVAIHLHPTLKCAFLTFISGIKLRIGTGYRFYSDFYSIKIYEHRKASTRHESDYNHSLLKPLGITSPLPLPFVKIPQKTCDVSMQLLLSEGLVKDAPFILIHPGSGGSSLDWPVENFVKLVKLLIENDKYSVVLTGKDNEKIITEKINHFSGQKCIDLAGKTDLKTLGGVMLNSRLVVANSTGPLHLASSLKIPTISFFPPIVSSSSKRWGPLGENNMIFSPRLAPCIKCTGNKCEQFNCMNLINVDEVYSCIRKILP